MHLGSRMRDDRRTAVKRRSAGLKLGSVRNSIIYASNAHLGRAIDLLHSAAVTSGHVLVGTVTVLLLYMCMHLLKPQFVTV